jgi:cytoskeletal protein RodZ
MAFLAPVAAQVGATTLSKVLPWAIVVVVIAGLGGALWLQTGRLHNARAALETMTSDRNLQKASAEGWQAASAERDQVIKDQAADLTKLAADKRHAQQIADQQVADQAKAIMHLNDTISAMKARANAHPEQTVPLGAIANDVLDSLCGKAGAADPAAACD